MDRKDLTELLDKIKAGTATAAEEAAVKRWLHALNTDGPSGLSDEDLAQARVAMWQAVKAAQEVKVRRLWPRIAAAASIIIALSVGYYLLRPQPKVEIAKVEKLDLAPGNQSAILQLSNGERIALNDAKAGQIATQGNTTITKANNQLIYKGSTEELIYNTVTTKRGNFYPLTLSDGTLAILDAGSSIRYPVNFIGNERRVEITGQVYFEVKHNEKMPFRVSVKGQIIEDIGTAFNVNAYDDEPVIRTTLIEGSIQIQNKTLTPGQQAIIKNGNMKIEQADTEEAVAWKNGLFKFNDAPVEEVMRQLSRWYDVDIEYPGGVPHKIFNGKMLRNTNASQVLEILSFSNVNFQIVQGSKGKKILVKP